MRNRINGLLSFLNVSRNKPVLRVNAALLLSSPVDDRGCVVERCHEALETGKACVLEISSKHRCAVTFRARLDMLRSLVRSRAVLDFALLAIFADAYELKAQERGTKQPHTGNSHENTHLSSDGLFSLVKDVMNSTNLTFVFYEVEHDSDRFVADDQNGFFKTNVFIAIQTEKMKALGNNSIEALSFKYLQNAIHPESLVEKMADSVQSYASQRWTPCSFCHLQTLVRSFNARRSMVG